MESIQADRLVKAYGKVRALDELSFGVPTGTVFGLLGPNGAGKSTAVKILTTLSRPDGGNARVAGIDVRKNPDQVRAAIGCVTQKISVDPQATGRENLLLHGALYGMSRRQLRLRAGELMARFDLAEAADRQARTYSGGMQRKLDVAMGLIHRPRVLFLDEPTTGLDPEARAAMWTEIARLAAEEGLTILLTTHYLEEADKLAGALAIVDRGKVVTTGSPDELKSQLRGDAIVAELVDSQGIPQAEEALRRVHGAREITTAGRVLRARVDDGAAAVPAVLAALDAAGVKVGAITVARPSLDDVYLRHTGRTFEEVAA
ncbi:ABC-2 type transport system ATP-binding protein [Streptosporangium subroseum]|uniref:ABC-2 type transport system ATP-binding protein n=1 Tax=Streptosporangium subroseum TaxID=106412 RepID=A0A239B7J9_9ACTN|nr:ATP-binding cassette domain-containing protein [Streptosporangium subroseum]SNS03935.1 ABC-2 type transport system ATP-binding protein [Streptosporangium subroseum]